MASRRSERLSRDQLGRKSPSKRQPKIPPLPTVSIERPVVGLDAAGRKKHLDDYHAAFGKEFSKKQKERFAIIDPNYMAVPLLQGQALAEQVQTRYRPDQRYRATAHLTVMLGRRLAEMLQDVPPVLTFPIGKTALRNGQSARAGLNEYLAGHVVHELLGWRGANASYNPDDGTGDVNATWQLARESRLIKDAIADESPWLESDAAILEPALPIVGKKRRYQALFEQREFVTVASALKAADELPQVFTLGDPVLRLHFAENGEHRSGIYPLRALEYDELRRAA